MLRHRRFVLSELIDAVFRSVLPRSRANYDSRTLSECREKMWLLCGEMELGETRVKPLFQDEIAYQVADTDRSDTASYKAS